MLEAARNEHEKTRKKCEQNMDLLDSKSQELDTLRK